MSVTQYAGAARDTARRIEREIKSLMKKDNRAYCNTSDVEYTLESAKRTHDGIVKNILDCCGIKKAGKVLDVGCGFGDLVFSLAPYAKRVYGTDIDGQFIKVCNKKKTFLKIDNVDFIEAPSERVPFKDETFDLVVSKTVLEHVGDVNKSISEIARVAKKGGRIYIECPNYLWFREDHYKVWMLPLMPKWLFKLYLRALGKNPKFIEHINYVTPKMIESQLRLHKVQVRNVAEDIMEDILEHGPTAIARTHKYISKLIKVTSALGLNRCLLWIAKLTNMYPIIMFAGVKK